MLFPKTYKTPCCPITYRHGGGRFLRDDGLERCRKTDGRVDVLSGGGLPLGLFPDAEPERESIELGQDDLLFFYSDGVTDARSPDMEYFEDRLADELAGAAGRTAAQTTRMVQDLVARFSQDDLRDDMTILVARVTPPAAG